MMLSTLPERASLGKVRPAAFRFSQYGRPADCRSRVRRRLAITPRLSHFLPGKRYLPDSFFEIGNVNARADIARECAVFPQRRNSVVQQPAVFRSGRSRFPA